MHVLHCEPIRQEGKKEPLSGMPCQYLPGNCGIHPERTDFPCMAFYAVNVHRHTEDSGTPQRARKRCSASCSMPSTSQALPAALSVRKQAKERERQAQKVNQSKAEEVQAN